MPRLLSAPASLERSWRIAASTAVIRLGAGAVLAGRPGLVTAVAGADPADRLALAVVRALGVRDTALGLTAALATRPGADTRRQLVLQGLTDVGDAVLVGVATATGRLPRWRGIGGVAVALGSAAIELGVGWSLPSAAVSAALASATPSPAAGASSP